MATGTLSSQRPSSVACARPYRNTTHLTPILAARSPAQPQNNPTPTAAPRKSTISRFRGATTPDLLTSPCPSPCPTTPTAPAPSWPWVGSSADGSLVLPTTTNVFYALHKHHNQRQQQQHQTSSPAICVLGSGSGGETSGGLQSAALALGWLRALHGLGVLHRAQLLAAGPGLCSWLAAAVCYATQQQEQEGLQCGVEDAVGRLLGPIMPPEQCGLMGVGMGAHGGLARFGAGRVGSSGGLEAMLADAAGLLSEYGTGAEQQEVQHEEQEQGCPCSGLHTALEQRIDTIIALVPSQVHLEAGMSAFARANKEMAGLFGRWEHECTATAQTYNDRHQVFPSPAFDDLLAALRARHSAGGPAVHVASYTLEPNSSPHSCCADPSARHTSPRRMRVVWVVNAEHGSWEGRLPWHVRFELHTDRRLAEAGMLGGSTASMDEQQQQQQQGQQQQWYDSLHDFPYCASLASTRGTATAALALPSRTPSLTPSPQLVSLLAHHAAGMVEGAREQLREVLGQL